MVPSGHVLVIAGGGDGSSPPHVKSKPVEYRRLFWLLSVGVGKS